MERRLIQGHSPMERAFGFSRAVVAGGTVVRTRLIVDPGGWQEVARAHGEAFAEIRPAATAIVTGLLDPRWRVELEAEAILPA